MSPSSAVEVGYVGYQLIRNVLAAYAEGCSFCVMHDDRRSDLREAWYEVLAAPGSLPSWRFGRPKPDRRRGGHPIGAPILRKAVEKATCHYKCEICNPLCGKAV